MSPNLIYPNNYYPLIHTEQDGARMLRYVLHPVVQ